jgi:class 3 adenylate cyclase/tetratricopeptide (TPR) repeat protein
MQDAIRREGVVITPGGRRLELGLKVAVAAGPARRFAVGDPGIQLIDVLAGSLVDRIAAVEGLATMGELLVHESALAAVAAGVELGESRFSDDAGHVAVVAGLAPGIAGVASGIAGVAGAGHEAHGDELSPELARPWLLAAVYDRLAAGHAEFLAELRPAYPLFVGFGGIDYDADEAARDKLDAFVRAAQRILVSFGGTPLSLTIGDKGAYLHGVFGTPVAHEDDAERACAASLELSRLPHSTAVDDLRIGVSYGRLHSGTYGHARRRTFGCLGDAVNLAARLMAKAPAGSVYVSDEVRARLGDGFEGTRLEPLSLKGKASPVVVYSLTGVDAGRSRRASRHELPLVGRTAELARLEAHLMGALNARGGIAGVSAEAGMGKSRLIAEFARVARERGVLVATGECQAYGTSAAYFVWASIWRTLFALEEDAPAEEQIATLEWTLGEIDPAFVPRAPLLGAVLGLPIPDTDLTRAFDPELRKASLENLLADCLRSLAARRPILLVLEDCHWLDSLSRDLLAALARTVAALPVLLVLAYRPDAALRQGLALRELPGLDELQLTVLEEPQMRAMVEAKLAALLGDAGGASASLRDLVVSRAQGNPFYAEELLNYVHVRGVDLTDARALGSLELPDSLHSLVLGRIDTLTESHRRTLKVASVVGRAFRVPMLRGVHADLGEIDAVRASLAALREFDLVMPDRPEDESYLIKHTVTQEVAYESLPYALRATLHGQVGAYLERQSDPTERQLDLLAHHYWHSSDDNKKKLYLGLAAERAQASYANAAAIDYYERLAPLLDGGRRVDALLELGKVLELVGDWDRARTTASSALELADEIGDERSRAWCEVALAEVARKQNQFDEAADRLARATAAFERTGDDKGLGQVLHLEGTLAAQRGQLAEARARYERSLAVRRRLGDVKMMASVLSNLGIVAEYEGDYPLSRSLHEQALGLRTEFEDRWAIANSMTNLGMIATLEGRNAEARDRFEEAMRLNREVGDSWRVVVCHNNLGNANRGLGDFAAAAAHYAACLRAHRERDDKWSLAFLLEDVGRLAALTGSPEVALELLGAADALREQIGAPRAAALERAILGDVEEAAAALSPSQLAAARDRGRALDQQQAIEAGLALVA